MSKSTKKITEEEIIKERKKKFYTDCILSKDQCLTEGWIQTRNAIEGAKIKTHLGDFKVRRAGDRILTYDEVIRIDSKTINKIIDEHEYSEELA